jgi:hypothetical protein
MKKLMGVGLVVGCAAFFACGGAASSDIGDPAEASTSSEPAAVLLAAACENASGACKGKKENNACTDHAVTGTCQGPPNCVCQP